MVEAFGQGQGRERRQLRVLADDRVPRRECRRGLPGEQQQRIVPWHDAADHAERVHDDERELSRLDRWDDPTGRVAADLGVVVEGGGAPVDLVPVLDQRLPALRCDQRGEPILVLPQLAGHLVEQLTALDGRGARPAGPRLPGGSDRRVELVARDAADGRDRLLGVRVLDRQRLPLAGDLFRADQQPSLDPFTHRRELYSGRTGGGASHMLRAMGYRKPTAGGAG